MQITEMTDEEKAKHTETQTQLAKEARDDFATLAKDDPIVKFFAYSHLPERLQPASKPFGDLALHLCASIPRCAERTAALRKLLEAKDCAVRASLP